MLLIDHRTVRTERLVKQLKNHTDFLREELTNKNNMINYLLEQSSKRGDAIFSYKNQVYNLKQKLSDLHTAQSKSYNSIIIMILRIKEMEITIKAIKTKAVLSFMIIKVSIKALTQKFQ